MPTIDSSFGGPTANSYISLSSANSYMTTVLDVVAWSEASVDMQERALLQATRDIDTLRFRGTRYYPAQRLKLPVQLEGDQAVASLVSTLTGYEYVRMEKAVQDATCEQALYLLRIGGRQRHWELRQQGVVSKSEGIGPLSESYAYSGGRRVCHEAVTLLGEWLGTPRLVRG